MLIHIVKTGETIDKITNSYRILKSDLISNNLHITDFSHLKSGMKLKIPLLSKDSIETLEESEAFIDDYYPSFEKFLNSTEEYNTNKQIEEESKQEEIIDVEPEQIIVEKTKVVEKKENIVLEEKKIEVDNNGLYRSNNIYQNYYSGNVIPNYNNKFIKKI